MNKEIDRPNGRFDHEGYSKELFQSFNDKIQSGKHKKWVFLVDPDRWHFRHSKNSEGNRKIHRKELKSRHDCYRQRGLKFLTRNFYPNLSLAYEIDQPPLVGFGRFFVFVKEISRKKDRYRKPDFFGECPMADLAIFKTILTWTTFGYVTFITNGLPIIIAMGTTPWERDFVISL